MVVKEPEVKEEEEEEKKPEEKGSGESRRKAIDMLNEEIKQIEETKEEVVIGENDMDDELEIQFEEDSTN